MYPHEGGTPPGDPYGPPSGPPYGQPSVPPYGEQPYGSPYGQPSGPPYGEQPYGSPYGQPYGPPPGMPMGPPEPPKKSKAPLIIGIVAVVVLLCCGGGIGLLVFANNAGEKNSTNSGNQPTPSPTSPRGPTGPGTSPSEGEITGDLTQFRTGDCLVITADDEVKKAKCTDGGAYRVLKRVDGTIAESACDGTDYTEYLTEDGPGTKDDLILCIKPAA